MVGAEAAVETIEGASVGEGAVGRREWAGVRETAAVPVIIVDAVLDTIDLDVREECWVVAAHEGRLPFVGVRRERVIYYNHTPAILHCWSPGPASAPLSSPSHSRLQAPCG